jgi:hypothetical protein
LALVVKNQRDRRALLDLASKLVVQVERLKGSPN